MNLQDTPAMYAARPFLTTEELASMMAVRPQSIRKRYMETGSYHGVRPVKLPNRFLAWPNNALEQLMGGVAA
ncbi:DNA-binding protein [Burkholderia cenocepacia]|uniref:DNA-binding protein n=1 Tax=Burkholderia cenocepacia TaxID=95486 RepID=UPI001B910CAE|nr:DNA-binding protein [Burkholderia cenocepacia]MBR7970232.1 DNA-binding protein [Burkholderia cenocepacia]